MGDDQVWGDLRDNIDEYDLRDRMNAGEAFCWIKKMPSIVK